MWSEAIILKIFLFSNYFLFEIVFGPLAPQPAPSMVLGRGGVRRRSDRVADVSRRLS